LYGEALAMALGKIYTFGPTFRAEKSKTRRHLTEFWMLEPEAAYVELDEAMALGEGLVSAIVQGVLKNKSCELETLKRDPKKLECAKPPFPRISYEEAVAVLHKNGNPAKFGDDFGGDEETIISSSFDRPVLVHRYPTSLKAFYMQPDPKRPELALAFDMLAPEGYGEIIGGSQRIHDYDLLVQRVPRGSSTVFASHQSRTRNGAKGSHHRRPHGPRPKPPRRGHGPFRPPRCGPAFRHQKARPHGGRHRQPRSETARRNARRRKAREVSSGNCGNLPGHLQDGRKILGRELPPARAWWGSLHRGRRGGRRGFAFSP